jgi:hypothetical protein
MEEITSTVVDEEFNIDSVAARNFNITSYARAQAKMIATNDRSYSGDRYNYHQRLSASREYTPEEITRIIESGTLHEKKKLSRNYFYKDGYYKQIIIHYATLLKYAGLLIPNPSFGKKLSTSHINKRYFSALEYVENMSLPLFFTNCAQIALVDGTYFGVRVDVDKNSFSVIDLPSGYA